MCWSLWLIALAGGASWTLVGPLLLTVLLLKVCGAALTEKDIASRRPGYQTYIRRTAAPLHGAPGGAGAEAAGAPDPVSRGVWVLQPLAGLGDASGAGKATTPDLRSPAERHRAMSWAQRLKRVFGIKIATCEQCGGPVKVIASIEDPTVIGRDPGLADSSLVGCLK